ncbi:MAG: hypothetical protein WC728_07865 [Elusimicrobiota bacterium]
MNRLLIAVALTGLIGAVGLLVLKQFPPGGAVPPSGTERPGPERADGKPKGNGTEDGEAVDARKKARQEELCRRLEGDAKRHAELARKASQRAHAEGTVKNQLEAELRRGMDGQRRILQTQLIGTRELAAQQAATEAEKEAALVRELADTLEGEVQQCGAVGWALQEAEKLAKSARGIAGKEATYRPADAPAP